MTTGRVVTGSQSAVGVWVSKTWTGSDWTLASPRRKRWSELPPITDAWGNPVDPVKDRLIYLMELRAAKGRSLRQQRARAVTSGAIELHAYQKNHITCNFSEVKASDGRKGGYGNYFQTWTYTDPWTANDDIKLIEKLREKIIGSDINFGVALAEVDKTYRMLGGNLTNLAWGLSSLRKGDVAAAFQWLFRGDRARREREISPLRGLPKGAANMYLWWMYGIKPLLDDSDALLRYIAWREGGNTPLKRYRVRRQLPLADLRSPDPNVWFGGPTFGWSGGAITAYVSDVNVPSLTGMYDIPSLLYERTMYSFVLDWAVPIGAWLNARCVANALKGQFCTTRRIYLQCKPVYIKPTGAPPNLVSWSGFESTLMRYHFIKRTVSSSLNAPFPTIKPVRKVISVTHALEALSLLTNKLRFLA